MANSANNFIFMAPTALLVAAILAFSVNTQWHRLKCALCVFIPTLIHTIWLNDAGGEAYYLSAMAFNGMTIAALDLIKRKTATSLLTHLQIISFVFMLANFAGYAMWYAYMAPDMYNWATLSLSVCEVVRLLIHTNGDKKDGIDSRSNHRQSDANERGLGSRG